VIESIQQLREHVQAIGAAAAHSCPPDNLNGEVAALAAIIGKILDRLESIEQDMHDADTARLEQGERQ
jgi:hypothetical protein